MIGRCLLLIAVLLLSLDQAEAGDTYPSQTSRNGKAKVTLLYIGTNHDKDIPQPCVVIFLLEDCRTKEEIQRNPTFVGIAISPHVYASGTTFPITISGYERGGMYEYALQPSFRALYSLANIPKPKDPKYTGFYEFYYKWVPKGPVRILFLSTDYSYSKTPEISFDDIGVSGPPSP